VRDVYGRAAAGISQRALMLLAVFLAHSATRVSSTAQGLDENKLPHGKPSWHPARAHHTVDAVDHEADLKTDQSVHRAHRRLLMSTDCPQHRFLLVRVGQARACAMKPGEILCMALPLHKMTLGLSGANKTPCVWAVCVAMRGRVPGRHAGQLGVPRLR
jgi:hypothetical protein